MLQLQKHQMATQRVDFVISAGFYTMAVEKMRRFSCIAVRQSKLQQLSGFVAAFLSNWPNSSKQYP